MTTFLARPERPGNMDWECGPGREQPTVETGFVNYGDENRQADESHTM